MPPITPITANDEEQTQPRLTIDPQITAPDGSFYVFDPEQGYRQVVAAHEADTYIPPFKASEKLGDVESWVQYVTGYAHGAAPFLTWSTKRLYAVLDYGLMSVPGRGRVIAEHPFTTTREWDAWTRLADNRQRSQKTLIEALEELRPDIREPDAAELVGMLSSLKATINTSAEHAIDAHGNSTLKYSRDARTPLKLPASMKIAIPVLKGHTATDSVGKVGPVVYEVVALIRVDILDEGEKSRPVFRLTIPNAEQTLEDAVADRVAAAKTLLGELGETLLRAAN